MTDLSDAAEEKKVMIMRNEKEILKQNDARAGINIRLGLKVAVLVVCAGLIYKIGASVICVIGVYILIRSILKIIRLVIRILLSILSILFLIAVIAILIVLIF